MQQLNEWANFHSQEVSLYIAEKFEQRTAEGFKFIIESGSEKAKLIEILIK